MPVAHETNTVYTVGLNACGPTADRQWPCVVRSARSVPTRSLTQYYLACPESTNFSIAAAVDVWQRPALPTWPRHRSAGFAVIDDDLHGHLPNHHLMHTAARSSSSRRPLPRPCRWQSPSRRRRPAAAS